MKPLKLTLTGFKGIQAGMGLETFSIDFRAYEQAQLIAIVAPNGRGKTTVLDNLQPYRLMPSKIRGANYSPEAFSFFDHLVSPGDASKELIWEHNGQTYRSLFEWKIREKTQSTAAYLQVKDGDQWKPVTFPNGLSSDGKAKTYDACVEAILGSPRLYFTAAFSAQGRSQLSSYAQGDIKNLMSEVLGLHRIQELGAKAAEVNKGLTAKLNACRNRLLSLDAVKQQATELRDAIAEHTRALQGHLANIERHRQAANIERIAVAEMQRAQQDAEELRVRREVIKQQIQQAEAVFAAQRAKLADETKAAAETFDQRKAALQEQHDAALKVIDSDITQVDQQFEQEKHRLLRNLDAINDEINRATARKNSAAALLAQREQILKAQEDLPGLHQNLVEAEATLTAAREATAKAREAKAALQQTDRHLASLVEAGRAARARETELVQRCALTKEVPCQGMDLQGRCRLLSDAIEAEKLLPVVQLEITNKTNEYREAQQQRDAMAAIAATLSSLETAEQEATKTCSNWRNLISTTEQLAAKADSLSTAEAAVEDAEAAIQSASQRGEEIRRNIHALEQQSAERLAELNARRDQAVTQHSDALAQIDTERDARLNEIGERLIEVENAHQANVTKLQTELDRIPVPGDDGPLKAAQQRLAEAETAEQAAREAADRARGAIATAEGRLSALEGELAESAALTAEAAHLESEISQWSLLQKALGRDGILALSIDDAGPTLASLTNDLLLSCYGPRFSVRIDTQETVKSTGAQKETFDVIVFDAESNTEKSVSDMSGGEKIWINEALTRAIALYQAQSSGRTFHTLFSDESDGALDPEKKGQFVRMKRRVLELGGYEQEFFISHSPDVWPLADALIHLGTDYHQQAA